MGIRKLLVSSLLAALFACPFASAQSSPGQDLNGLRLALYAAPVDYTAEDIHRLTGVLPAEVMPFESLDEALIAIDEKRADMLLAPATTCAYIRRSTSANWLQVAVEGSENYPLPLVLRAADSGLLDSINGAIAALMADGTAQALDERWCAPAFGDVILTPKSMRATTGTLRIAFSNAYPPLSYTSPQDERAGYLPAFAREIATKIGMEVEFVDIAAQAQYGALMDGAIDAFFFAAIPAEPEGCVLSDSCRFETYSFMLRDTD